MVSIAIDDGLQQAEEGELLVNLIGRLRAVAVHRVVAATFRGC